MIEKESVTDHSCAREIVILTTDVWRCPLSFRDRSHGLVGVAHYVDGHVR